VGGQLKVKYLCSNPQTMTSITSYKRVLPHGIAFALCLPVGLYMAENCWNCGLSWWKTGWTSRPFIYIGGSGILVYVLYVAAASFGLGCLWKKTKDCWIGLCSLLLATMLGLYWLGFLTWSIGILPNR
jgi:hypothetical protein